MRPIKTVLLIATLGISGIGEVRAQNPQTNYMRQTNFLRQTNYLQQPYYPVVPPPGLRTNYPGSATNRPGMTNWAGSPPAVLPLGATNISPGNPQTRQLLPNQPGLTGQPLPVIPPNQPVVPPNQPVVPPNQPVIPPGQPVNPNSPPRIPPTQPAQPQPAPLPTPKA